jgi:TPR repeat protein
MLNSARFDDLSGRFDYTSGTSEYVNRIEAVRKVFDYWEGAPRDYADGARWIRRAAEAGEFVGLGFLAGAISAGDDFKKGLRKAAEQGCVDAQVILGEVCLCEQFGDNQWRLLRKGSRYMEALMWFGVAALRGDAEAQLCLGSIYAKDPGYGAKGTGISKNLVEAAHWYRKSAEQGNVRAQMKLGRAYERGLGLPQDDAQAAKWYQEAAEQGAGHAQYKLGCMYAEGKGVLTNEVEAMKWYRIAAGQDDAWAQRALGHAYEYGLGVPQDLAQAVEWYQKAAEERIGRPGGGLGKDDLERLKQPSSRASSEGR